MNKMVAVIFNTEQSAVVGLKTLNDLHKENKLTLYAAAIIVKEAEGIRMAKTVSKESPATVMLQSLTKVISDYFNQPEKFKNDLATLAADFSNIGINFAFLDEITKALTQGKAAILAEIQETWVTPANTKLRELDGCIFRQFRSTILEDQLIQESSRLNTTLTQLEEELTRVNAENEAALRREFESIKNLLKASQEQTQARQTQIKNERTEKINILNNKMVPPFKKKADIEKWLSEVNTDFEIRTNKLAQALDQITQTLNE